MKTGWPPTAPKARAGLFTPPGMTRQARAKASWLRRRSVSDVMLVFLFKKMPGGQEVPDAAFRGRLAELFQILPVFARCGHFLIFLGAQSLERQGFLFARPFGGLVGVVFVLAQLAPQPVFLVPHL